MQPATQEMLDVLSKLREKAAIGFVGGSDFNKIDEQLSVHGSVGMYFVLLSLLHDCLFDFHLI